MCWFRFFITLLLAILIVIGLLGLLLMLDYKEQPSPSTELTSPVSKFQAVRYFQQYGYMDEYNTTGSFIVSDEAVTTAIIDFQKFAGIPVTGKLDDATINMIEKPRCGVKDKPGDHGSALQDGRWSMKNLSYRISQYPSKLRNKTLVDNEIERALKVWSDVTSLKFINHAKEHVDLVHLDVRFEKGDHGDGLRFDDQGHILAHAFSPHCGSEAHFNDEVQWTVDEDQGTNLFQVAAHEFGHSLGLDHSDMPNSMMSPFYEGYDPRKNLNRDDILKIQALYGSPNRVSATVPPRLNPDPSGPDLCSNPSIDAATIVDDGRAFVFQGHYYWEIVETGGIVDGPRKISEDWDGLPGYIDAAMTWSDRNTYIFKDDLIYRFRNQIMDSEYPKPIHVEFPGIPNNLDAAFVWSGNGKAYFFKGYNYWRFDSCKHPPILSYYPLQVNGWKGLPYYIDAALLWRDQKTYFFRGNTSYRFNDRAAAVDKRLSTADFWFHCSSKYVLVED